MGTDRRSAVEHDTCRAALARQTLTMSVRVSMIMTPPWPHRNGARFPADCHVHLKLHWLRCAANRSRPLQPPKLRVKPHGKSPPNRAIETAVHYESQERQKDY